MLYNELQHSITNEYPDEITRRAMSDRILKDSLTDFIRGLKTEIGQVLLGNPSHNVIEAKKRATEIERYFREGRTRKQQIVRLNNRLQYKPRPVTNYVHTTQADSIYLRSANPQISEIVKNLQNDELAEDIANTYELRSGTLYLRIQRKGRSLYLPIVSRGFRWSVINHVHQSIMQLGWDKTLEKLYEYYWFEGMA